MLAFHSDPKIKRKYLDRVARHRRADELVRGATGQDGKGCAVWCTLNKYDHAAYQTELGVPRILAQLEDRFFENMPNAKAMEWPSRFLRAIPVGADLTMIWPAFAHWMLADEERGVIVHAKTDRAMAAIRAVAALFERQLAGGSVSRDEWNEARKNAYADAAAYAAYAAYAADAAAYAAYAARSRSRHFSLMADKLIELLEAAPVKRKS